MKVISVRRYENNFLIIVSLLIAMVYTLPFFVGGLMGSGNSANLFTNPDWVIPRSLWYLAQSFVSLLVFSYFNFRWKDYLMPARFSGFLFYLLLSFYNILLIILMLFLTIFFAEYTVGNPFGKDKAIYFYLWKYILIYPTALLMAYILQLLTKSRIIEIENIKLREESLSSQLKSLKDQINPHFLFNSLNTLSSVIRVGKKESALQFVDDLSNVYRYVLERYEENTVNLRDELKVLESYIFMLKERFGDKLIIRIDIPEKMKSAYVPPMALHVLIENAIKHNEVSAASPLHIEIDGKENEIRVRNKLQKKAMDQDKLGLGLSNLSKRYQLLSGKDILIQANDDEFVVKIPIILKP
ncbi:MAG: histidine kinase [Bacteroidota bacterium]|nr:histidine kinase [Bacteroidota bacterium]